MAENVYPKPLTKKDFFQIEECYCGKKPFSYTNVSTNTHVSKCSTVKEEYDIKTRKWVPSKKQPCEFNCVYYGERVVFNEIKNKLIQKANRFENKDTALEKKLKLLFQFVFISSHSETLDEINIIVKNELLKEPRKIYYFPSPGHLRISHYESLEDYRTRIFSEKIIDRSHLIKPDPKIECDITFFSPRELFPGLKTVKPVKPVKTVKAIKPVKKLVISSSQFIVVPEDKDLVSDSDKDSEFESDEDISEYPSDEENETKELSDVEIEEEPVFDDYESGGDQEIYD